MNLLDHAKASGRPPSILEIGALVLLRMWPCWGTGWSAFEGERCTGCSYCLSEPYDESEIGESGA
jgi:hypothetical protein